MSLQSMQVPFDGDPSPVAANSEEDVEWDWDDPGPAFEFVPRSIPVVAAVDVKVIALDLFGTVFDRETAIQEAVLLVTRRHPSNRTPRQLLELYLECESLRSRTKPDAPYIALGRGALADVVARVGVCVSEETLDDGLKCLLRPRLFADVIPAIKSLCSGCTILGFSSLDTHTFSEHFQPSIPAQITVVLQSARSTPLHSQNPSLFPEILDYTRSVYDNIKPAQIFIVTAAPYRVVEPASAADFPTALLRRADGLESHVNVGSATPTLVIDELAHLSAGLARSASRPMTCAAHPPALTMHPFRICGFYQATRSLGFGSFGSVYNAFQVLTGEEVAVKFEMPTGKPKDICVLPYEAQVYRQFHGYPGISSLRWYGIEGGAHVIILDKLGPNLQQLRRVCRGRFSLKTVLLLAEQLLTHIEFVHSRGIILRDVKPENFAMGFGERSNIVHLFDFGLAKLFMNPETGEHIPFRQGRIGLGTPRYASHNVHFGREQSRRDDVEALGNVLLLLLHGRLPWQGIYAPSIEAKMSRIGEMKAGNTFQDLLERSPPEFTRYFDHCRKLEFEDTPDYALLKNISRRRMVEEGWIFDDGLDWLDGKSLEKGTLLPDEYKIDSRFLDHDLEW